MENFDQDIQRIANKIRGDVEKELKQAFNRFEVAESHPISTTDPNQNAYSLKVNTDDKNQGHVKLRTTQRDSQSPWETHIDEFFRGVSPFENALSLFDPARTGFGSIQQLADRIKSDVEKDLNRTFETFDVMEHHPILTDPEHTSYYMRVKTDDNGHVRVKTLKKEPGSDWNTHVEEYQRGKKRLEGQKPTEPIKDKETTIEEEKPAPQ